MARAACCPWGSERLSISVSVSASVSASVSVSVPVSVSDSDSDSVSDSVSDSASASASDSASASESCPQAPHGAATRANTSIGSHRIITRLARGGDPLSPTAHARARRLTPR